MPHSYSAKRWQYLNSWTITEFRANGGAVGGDFDGFALLLLTSIGAKTSKERVNPLGYFHVDGKLIIAGSCGGTDKSPSWVANVRVNPNVLIEIGSRPPTSALAVELVHTQRDRVFEMVKRQAPGFESYEAATGRIVPLFELELAPAAAPPKARARRRTVMSSRRICCRSTCREPVGARRLSRIPVMRNRIV